MSDMVEHSLLFFFSPKFFHLKLEEAIPTENTLNGEDPTPDRAELGRVDREPNEDVTAVPQDQC